MKRKSVAMQIAEHFGDDVADIRDYDYQPGTYSPKSTPAWMTTGIGQQAPGLQSIATARKTGCGSKWNPGIRGTARFGCWKDRRPFSHRA